MTDERPYVMSIAGFDPSGGAGVLSDIKCFEQHKVYGFGVCTAVTVQTDNAFISSQWLDSAQIIAQISPLMERFSVKACKIGLVKNSETLLEIVTFIRSIDQGVIIVLDPVLNSSSGFFFHKWNMIELMPVLETISLITPNYPELQVMCEDMKTETAALVWSQYCPVLLKGGHNAQYPGVDLLYIKGVCTPIQRQASSISPKHGSGCVLSSAITANLAMGLPLEQACTKAKSYIESFLNSNKSLLGYNLI